MALRGILFQELLLGALILAAVGATEINSSCIRKCGSVSIPYPFGTDEGCYLNPSFLITCNQTFNPPKSFLRTGPIDVTDISLNGELRVPNWVARSCNGNRNQPSFSLGKFLVSNTKNKFFAVGCNTVAYVEGRTLQKNFTTGCSSHCDSIDSVVNGSCNGVGCCQSSIPQSITSFNVSFGILNDHFNVQSFNPCSFGFLAEETAYNFSSLDLVNLQGREEVPLVLDWAVGNETCIKAKKNQTNYACKAAHSECYNFINNPGYRCGCSDGYGGNPYLSDGCKDIDECNILKPCGILHECINVDGAFKCVCAKGYKEQKWRNIIVCNPEGSDSRSFAIVLSVGLSTSVGLLVLLIGGWLSYKILKKRRMIKQKKKFFKRNGGLLLQQKLFSYEANVENTKLFTSKDLEKATDHFNVNRILGQGGQGTVYKGMLVDGRIVAIKKSKVISEGKLQEFINEVVILSQINHRNVVKLIGCCLEIEVLLLVYEYVPNGTLAQYLSNQNEEFLLTWDMHLQIAIEVAEALYYLHSVASSPIYHRDIKSTNILLDDKYRAKVADFGTSRSITIDQTHLTTQVHGTWGYLDPEYFLSSQFTKKSDVYSFGVVLAELLTGEKVISSTRTEKSLVKYFLESIKENKLFDILDSQVLKDEKKEEKIAIANLTRRCLDLNGRMRPSMKEVEVELEAIQISRKDLKTHESHEELEHVKTEMDKAWDVATITTFGIDDGTSSSANTYPLLFSSG